jgi:glutamate/tyrosine decarboxylase-like PLP-dependent enzyme
MVMHGSCAGGHQPVNKTYRREEDIMSHVLKTAAERAGRYLDGLHERGVFPSEDAVARLAQFDEPLPDVPTDPETVLHLLDEIGSPATVASAGGRYFGFVTGGSLPAALGANWLAGAWDQNSGLQVMSPTVAKLEAVALGWLVDLLGLPAGTGGGFVTGATMANLTGLAAARHAMLQQAGWDVEAQGLFGAPPITVIVGDEVHVSLLKALSLLGLGRDRVIRVPVDNQGRMRADALPAISGPTIVCIQAGNVNTGAFDPAAEICAAAHESGAWVHVDGAFGLWAAAAPGRAHLMAGVSHADSWATDAHKWLNVPYDCGLAFCREPQHLRAAMSTSAAYLIEGDQREPYHYTPEMSRRARGIEIWSALRSLGRSGLADMIERTCRYAARFADGLAAAGFSVLNDVVLNQVLVSFGDAETTRRVIAAVQADGTCWCGGTVWQGQTAMRISVSSWATTEADVERCLEAMLRVAARV